MQNMINRMFINEFKVEANKVNYPSLMLQDHNTGVPYVVNSSNKGKLIINKVDALTETKKLNGAEFTVYGPFESKETANIAIESKISVVWTVLL
ncbi:MAG: hypothetical protein V8R63_11690 [Thomasclavelia ramosa]